MSNGVFCFHGGADSKHAWDCVSSIFSKQSSTLLKMGNLNERVSQAITQSGHNASSAARAIGVSAEAVLQWMNGPTKNLRNDNLFALADITGFSARWIGTGEGPMVECYSSASVKHVMAVMENLPPDEQTKLARLADAFVDPPANDHPPHGSVQQRKVDG